MSNVEFLILSYFICSSKNSKKKSLSLILLLHQYLLCLLLSSLENKDLAAGFVFILMWSFYITKLLSGDLSAPLVDQTEKKNLIKIGNKTHSLRFTSQTPSSKDSTVNAASITLHDYTLYYAEFTNSELDYDFSAPWA